MNIEELISALEPRGEMTADEDARVRQRITAATGTRLDEAPEFTVPAPSSDGPDQGEPSSMVGVDSVEVIELPTRTVETGRRPWGGRIVAAAAAAIALLVGAVWLTSDRDQSDLADQSIEVVEAFRFRMSPGSVRVAAFGGASFTSTLEAEVVQEASSLVVTSDDGTVHIFAPRATTTGQDVTTVDDVVTALIESGFELTEEAARQFGDNSALVFEVTDVSIDPAWALTLPAGDGLAEWSPVPDAKLLVSESTQGVLVASLEPAFPGGPAPLVWGYPLVDSFKLEPLPEDGE